MAAGLRMSRVRLVREPLKANPRCPSTSLSGHPTLPTVRLQSDDPLGLAGQLVQ